MRSGFQLFTRALTAFVFMAAASCSEATSSPTGGEGGSPSGAAGTQSAAAGTNEGGGRAGEGGAPGAAGEASGGKPGSGGAMNPGVAGMAGEASGGMGGSPAGAGGSAGAEGGSSPYPPGPYGEASPEVGATLENLPFQGYVNPTGEGLASEQPLIETSFAALREGSERYALIVVSAVWCASCKLSAPDLRDRGGEVIDAGGSVIHVLIDGPSPGTDATIDELEAWISTYDLSVTSLVPGSSRVRAVFDDREHVYVIDLETMQIVWRRAALYAEPSIVAQGIDAILELLD